CSAFASFRFKHQGLCSELEAFVPSLGLSGQEAHALQDAFERLDFEAPMLLRLRQLRG
ncbi:unnamed protein product, partial [Effrenium voratum]